VDPADTDLPRPDAPGAAPGPTDGDRLRDRAPGVPTALPARGRTASGTVGPHLLAGPAPRRRGGTIMTESSPSARSGTEEAVDHGAEEPGPAADGTTTDSTTTDSTTTDSTTTDSTTTDGSGADETPTDGASASGGATILLVGQGVAVVVGGRGAVRAIRAVGAGGAPRDLPAGTDPAAAHGHGPRGQQRVVVPGRARPAPAVAPWPASTGSTTTRPPRAPRAGSPARRPRCGTSRAACC